MGIEITTRCFDATAYQQFKTKLLANIAVLEQLVQRKDFGVSNRTSPGFGSELEMYLIDQQGQPLSVNQQILDDADDPQLTLELNRYNLEYNLTPQSLCQMPFEKTEQEILSQMIRLNRLAAVYQGRAVAIGILPTLNLSDFGPETMTDRLRYQALYDQLVKLRGCNFEVNINGDQPLKLEKSDLTLEGANASFQLHYRIEPEKYPATFNAVQLVTPLVVALAANSPGIFGHSLWQETRIPLFKQSIDTRVKGIVGKRGPARVSFGDGWLRHSVIELFEKIAQRYPPILPVCSEDDPTRQMEAGVVPTLAELRLHQSTVWLWNRPVYDDADGGHLRLEMRSLPAGPTAIDMVANAAFVIGLAEYYRHRVDELLPKLPFQHAEYNFYRAAQFGLDANIIWPETSLSDGQHQPILKVLSNCFSSAREGLKSIGISPQTIDKYLAVIERRFETRQTGAVWQRKTVKHYRRQHSNRASQRRMLADYVKYSDRNLPVSEWPLCA